MKLPNYEHAVVPDPKVRSYLLNETHPVGQHKAIFLRSFGFTADRWEELIQALLEHAASHEVVSTLETPEGIHFVIDGPMRSPDLRNPNVRTVWAIDTGQAIPRFITAYPLAR